MKKTKVGICPYCLKDGQLLSSKEHVVPKGWFIHDAFPYKKPIIIFTCHACNQIKSKDDSWMRMWLAALAFDKSEAAEKVMMGKVKDSVENGTFKRQFESHYSRMDLINCLPSGIHLPSSMTQIHVPEEDWMRARAYVDLVVRGVFQEKYNLPIPSVNEVQTFFANTPMLDIDPRFKPMFGVMSKTDWNMSNWPVFFCGMAKSVNSEHWICITVFYDTVAFLSFIGTGAWLEEKKTHASIK